MTRKNQFLLKANNSTILIIFPMTSLKLTKSLTNCY